MAQLYDASGNPFLTDVVQQAQSLAALNAQNQVQLRGQGIATVQVTGIGSLTLIFEVSTDGVNFDNVNAYPIAGGAGVLNTTANGHWILPVAGFYQFRVRVSAYTSGSALVSIVASQGAGVFPIVASGALSENLTQWATTALGVPANFGTTPGAVVAGSVNASAFIGTVAAVAAAAGIQKVGISGNIGVAIDGAIAAAPPANAVQVAPKAASANPANAVAGNAVALMSDLAGRLVVTPVNQRSLVKSQATTIAATGATTIVTAGAAGVFNDIIAIVITTAGLAAQTITISDGTVSWIIDYPNAAVAPNTPFMFKPSVPISASAAAVAWTANQSLATACHYYVLYAQRLG